MSAAFVLQLEAVIREYGVVGVLFAAFLEEIIAPIPSSLVAMLAGFFLVPMEYAWLQATIAASLKVAVPMGLGVTAGSLVIYAIAYYGGKPIIVRYSKWLGISWTSIEQTERRFTKGYADELTLLGARILPIVPSVAISTFCGLVRYPVKTFILLTLAGSFMRSTIMAMVGWQVRDAYISYAEVISRVETFVFISIIIICISFLFWRMIKGRKTL